MAINDPPFATTKYHGPTSVQLDVSETQGDPVQVFWRLIPTDLRDKVGPLIPAGSTSTVVIEALPSAGSILMSIARDLGGGNYSKPYSFPVSLVTGDTISSALGRKWDLVPTLTTLCGPLFSQEAPSTHLGKKIQLPWTVVCYDKSSYDFTFEDIYYETTQVDLSTYTLGNQAAELAAAEIHNHVDWQGLAFLDPYRTKVVRVEPLDYMIASTFTRHRTGQMVWNSRLSYLITLEKRHPRWKPYLD